MFYTVSIFDMAQKRNPVSLRLQTRLQGHEKRFASCWFTDLFFSQVYANDLVKRLYLGHLLQKGGSWCSDTSDSRVPETCISIQFLYRKCSIFSVVLDRRKEEYLLSTSTSTRQGLVKARQEDTTLLSQIEKASSRVKSTEQTDNKHLSVNGKEVFSSLQPNTQAKAFLRDPDNLLRLYGGVYTSLLSPHFRENVVIDKIVYQSIANSFGSIVAKHKHPVGVTLLDKWKDLLHKDTSSHYGKADTKQSFVNCKHVVSDLPYLSTIESICNFPRSSTAVDKSSTRAKHSFANNISLKMSSHWTSLGLIRGVSACQSVEFCLYSVLFLCKKRFSFLKIKELVFKMLASNPTVRGARLVCSGRQGGRSKSAMRAKKQSALWGETALSLFSSRLAFASTGVDTSFGQIGVKLWICYK